MPSTRSPHPEALREAKPRRTYCRNAIGSYACLWIAFILAGAPAGAQPLEDFLYYDRPQPPVSSDCRAIAAAIGADATWYGEFSGRYYDDFRDYWYPYATRGCFESELACRIWQNRALTYTGEGGMYYSFCRPAPGYALD